MLGRPIRYAHAVLGIAIIGACSTAQAQSPITVDIERISDRVIVARCAVGSNVTAIDTGEGLLIVDTHLSPTTMRAILDEVERALGTDEVAGVVNTHGDWDHCSGNQVFPDSTVIFGRGIKTSVCIRNHPADSFGNLWWQEERLSRDRDALESAKDPAEAVDLRERIFVREQILSDLRSGYERRPTTLGLDESGRLDYGDVTLVMLPCGAAHTVSDLFVYIPQEHVVMTGDVFCSSKSFCFSVSAVIGIPELLEALDSVLREGVDVVVPGHGPTFTGDDLQALRDRLKEEYAALAGKVSAARRLQEAIDGQGVESARLWFDTTAPDTSVVGNLSEEELYLLGSRYTDTNLDAAALVFDVATSYFPESALCHLARARFNLVSGDTLAAITAYERAHQLAPRNRQVAATIEWLKNR